MRGGRVAVNLAAIAVVSAVLLLYAFSSLLAGAIFDERYPVEVQLPEAGGLLAQQEVTMSGRVIGTVDGVRLEGEGVVARLLINVGEKIPTDVDVTVLRRSPIGEQALDFRPRSVGGDTLKAGERIVAAEAVTPIPVQRLLEQADVVLAPVDGERAGVLVKELAAAVRGRHDEIRGLVVDGARLSEALAANSDDIARFFDHSATVNAALARSRSALARSIGQMADASKALVEMRTDFEGLLREAPPVLNQVAGLIGGDAANLTCMLKDLGNLDHYLGQPEQIDDIEEALRFNQYFFEGARVGGPRDPAGRVWTRIKFLEPKPEQPDSYLPDKRPVPDILPGGPCVSPLGNGVGAATQPGYSKRVPDAQFVAAGGADYNAGAMGLAVPMGATSASSRLAESLGLLLALGAAYIAVRLVRRALRRADA